MKNFIETIIYAIKVFIEDKIRPINLAVHEALDTVNKAEVKAQEAIFIANEALTDSETKIDKNNPTGTGSFSMNRRAGSIIGENSHTEGSANIAAGLSSHAQGSSTIAITRSQHAEGEFNIADDFYVISQVELYSVNFSGKVYYSEAYTFDSTTGIFTLVDPRIANSIYDTINWPSAIIGKYVCVDKQNDTEIYKPGKSAGVGKLENGILTFTGYGVIKLSSKDNTQNRGTYAHIVGNGTSDAARSNAHTLDWDGNAWYAGDVYVGSTSGTNIDEGSKKLATEEFVEEAIESSGPKFQAQIITWEADD